MKCTPYDNPMDNLWTVYCKFSEKADWGVKNLDCITAWFLRMISGKCKSVSHGGYEYCIRWSGWFSPQPKPPYTEIWNTLMEQATHKRYNKPETVISIWIHISVNVLQKLSFVIINKPKKLHLVVGNVTNVIIGNTITTKFNPHCIPNLFEMRCAHLINCLL